MTTIPIEVIIQDAEAPVVPSEDGTNTNTNIEGTASVAVPDTGDSNGGIFSESASAIVLPAILLVLALGSIVAILIYKYHKQRQDKNSKKEKLATTAASTIAILAATVLVSNIVLPATKAATSDTTDGITPAEDKISIVVTRDGGVAEASIESTATITSTSDFGYKVLLSMAEGVETNDLYLDGDENSEYYIAPVEVADEESAELADNTWGYALEEDGAYSTVPLLANAAVIAQGNEPVEDEELTIYYGVKVSSDLPAGTYNGGELKYDLVGIEPTIDELTYMQDFAKLSADVKANVLRSMTEGEQYTLKDSRDKKDYFISKLADGNVWMTQNLDLDIEVPAEGSIVYNSTNTNLPTNTTWEPERATIASGELSSNTWQSDSLNPYSYDPGDVYYYTSGTTGNDIQYNSLEECVAANHIEAECRHYHVGNYYNWTAAIASNDSAEDRGEYYNATTSICPAGWRLPVGSNVEDAHYTEIIGVVRSYNNILGSFVSDQDHGSYYYPYLNGGFNAIRVAPLWLVRSGNIAYSSLRDIVEGKYWSSTADSSGASAYNFYFNSSRVESGQPGRGNGYSLRCLVE